MDPWVERLFLLKTAIEWGNRGIEYQQIDVIYSMKKRTGRAAV